MHDKILLIEDDASIIRFLSLSLDKNGYKVIEARNGIEGISLFMSDNPDLILLDLGLPDIDGSEVLRQIRSQSEVPILVGTFALGPIAGVVMEIVKILVKLVLKPTSTGFVGEFANLMIGCSLILPAGIIYRFHKTKKSAVLGMAAGAVMMAVVGVVINVYILIPFYSNLMPLDTIIQAGAAINPAISNVWTFALICVGPFNIIKGITVSLITSLVYKRISVIIHSAGRSESRSQART